LNPIPPVTKVLLWAIGIVFLLQQLNPDFATYYFALWPLGEFHDGSQLVTPFQPWQVLSYAFLHGNAWHLFFNALMLVQFGPRLELSLGRKRYIQFLLVCTLGAAACQLAVVSWMHANGYEVGPTVGASGYIYGILLGWAVLWPRDRLMLLLPPVEMSVRTMVLVFGGIELFMGITGTAQGVAHFAHLGGMLFGWLLLRYWQGKPPFGKRKPPPPKKPHLRSVN
jgi:membrane associated rhomboid family serine protease